MPKKRREPCTSSVPPANKVQCVRPPVHAHPVLGKSSPNSVPAIAVFVRFGPVTITVLSKAKQKRLAERAAAKQKRLDEQAAAKQERLAKLAAAKQANQKRLAKLAADKKALLAKLAADKQARLAEAEQARLAEEASVRALHGELVAAMQFIEQAKQAEQAEIASFFDLVATEPSAAARVEDAESYEQFQALCMGCE